jgi:hypothetical protein
LEHLRLLTDSIRTSDGLRNNLSVTIKKTLRSRVLPFFDFDIPRELHSEFLIYVYGSVNALLEDGDWPELFEKLFKQVEDSTRKGTSSRVFALRSLAMLLSIPEPYVQKHLNAIMGFFIACISTGSLEERVWFVAGTHSLSDLSPKDSLHLMNKLKQLVPLIVDVTKMTLEGEEKDEDAYQACLSALMTWTDEAIIWTLPLLQKTMNLLLGVLTDPKSTQDVLSCTLDLVASLWDHRGIPNLFFPHPNNSSSSIASIGADITSVTSSKKILNPFLAKGRTRASQRQSSAEAASPDEPAPSNNWKNNKKVEEEAAAAPSGERFIPKMIDIFFHLLTRIQSIEDDEEWACSSPLLDDLNVADMVEVQFDHFCLSLDSELIVPILLEKLPVYVKDANDWKRRTAGLMAISLCAEGCRELLIPFAGELVGLILSGLKDANPRVCYAAISAASQLCTDFGIDYCNNFHDTINPSIMALLQSSPVVRLQTISLAYFSSFYAPEPDVSTLEPILDHLMQPVLQLVKEESQVGHPSLRKFAVHEKKRISAETALFERRREAYTLIDRISSLAGDSMMVYYDKIFSEVKLLLASTMHPEKNPFEYGLRVAGIFSFTSLLEASGIDGREEDVTFFMDSLLSTQFGEFGCDSKDTGCLRTEVFRCSVKLGMILQSGFAPYIPKLLPLMLEAAEMEQNHYLLITQDVDEVAAKMALGWEGVTVMGRHVVVGQEALKEKSLSMGMLYVMVDTFGKFLLDEVNRLLETFTTYMHFPYSEEIRKAATMALPLVLLIVKDHGDDPARVLRLYDKLVNLVADYLLAEEFAVIPTTEYYIDVLIDLTGILPPNSLEAGQVNGLVAIHGRLIASIQESAIKLAQDQDKDMGDEEKDDDEEDEFNTEQEELGERLMESAEHLHTLAMENQRI